MNARLLTMWMVGLVLCTSHAALASVLDQAVQRAADRLVADQLADGSWQDESGFTGPCISGLVKAYQSTGNARYRTAAEQAGNFIVSTYGSSIIGEETYAMTRLSKVSSSADWRGIVSDFYSSHVPSTEGGTDAYIADIISHSMDSSTAVFQLAHHVIASSYVNAPDAAKWRVNLLTTLKRVQNTSYYPVMSTGAALWALEQTGGLTDSLIDPMARSESVWYGVKQSDLPTMLAAQVVTSGTAAGGFYYRFDHQVTTNAPYAASGYTEDTVFGLLGLQAAQQKTPSLNLWSKIDLGQQALANGIATDGSVLEHLTSGSLNYNLFIGDVLEALPEFVLPGDASGDNVVNGQDIYPFLKALAGPSLYSALYPNLNMLTHADLTKDGVVNGQDIYPFLKALGGNYIPAPEPASMALLAMGGFAALFRRTR